MTGHLKQTVYAEAKVSFAVTVDARSCPQFIIHQLFLRWTKPLLY